MSKFQGNRLNGIKPYVPGEQPKQDNLIKLNTNENPYPPSPNVAKAISSFDAEKFKLYPDYDCTKLREAICQNLTKYEGANVSPKNIFVGNGSDEVIALMFMAFFDSGNSGSPILFPDITYSFAPVWADIFDIPYKTIPLEKDFSIDPEKYCVPNGGTVIANPNAPTGICMSLSDIEIILNANTEKVCIIDEAYIDFGGTTAAALINTYPNLAVVRTFSKSHSLAGLRVGYAIASEELIADIDIVKNSFNSYTVNCLTLVAAEAAIKDREYFEKTRNEIIATREDVSVSLRTMGYYVSESKANFIFVSHPDIKAEIIFNELRSKNILVRYFNKPNIDNCLRISIGTREQMDTLIEALC